MRKHKNYSPNNLIIFLFPDLILFNRNTTYFTDVMCPRQIQSTYDSIVYRKRHFDRKREREEGEGWSNRAT